MTLMGEPNRNPKREREGRISHLSLALRVSITTLSLALRVSVGKTPDDVRA